MLTKIEFYNCPDGSINIKPVDGPMYIYDKSCRALTQELIIKIRDWYPDAFVALSDLYGKSAANRDYYEFQIVHRFIRCNFGEYDTMAQDISITGQLNLEEVRCPLRGECKLEGLVCKPRLQTKLSERELEVARLVNNGLSRDEIAQELGISICTVGRHITNIKARLHISRTSHIAKFYNDTSK